MYDATDHLSGADEIITAVRALRVHRDELMGLVDDLSASMDYMRFERDQLRRRLAELEDEEPKVLEMQLPSGRDFVFVEDAGTLAISPDMDPEREARLLAQIEARPRLTPCSDCGAPIWPGGICLVHED
jgi:hypothetical protein